MFETLQLENSGDVALITLSRPEKRNAISPQMISDLLAALDQIEKSPTRVAILTGTGKAFCAGMDLESLSSIAQQSPEQNLEDSRRMAQMFRRIWRFPKPLIAAVNGAAIAGGCGIATLCDFTLAVPEAKFGYTEVKIGFLPAIVSVFLTRQIGDKRARDLLLTGRLVTATEAKELGLVTEIVAPENLQTRANELAATLVDASPTSLARTKRLLTDATAASVDEDLEKAIHQNAQIRSTADFKEGVASFLEKRKPKWQAERGMTDSLNSTAPRASAHNDAMIRVRYAETDQMGVVYHANYLIWFEVGRVELMRALGVEYKSMEKDDDCHIVVVQANCRYLHPAKYDEELRVRTRIAGMRNRSISFAYEVFRDHDQTLAGHRRNRPRHLRLQRKAQNPPAEIPRHFVRRPRCHQDRAARKSRQKSLRKKFMIKISATHAATR